MKNWGNVDFRHFQPLYIEGYNKKFVNNTPPQKKCCFRGFIMESIFRKF